MSYLIIEILLRLSKVLLASVLSIFLYAFIVGPLGAPGSPELAVLSWLAAAAFVLLIQSGPI